MKKTVFLALALLTICSGLLAAPTQRTRYNLNYGWYRIEGDTPVGQVPLLPSEGPTVGLPYADTSRDGGQTVWYAKTFKLPSQHKGQKLFLEFDGIAGQASVWINGRPAGEQEDGPHPFGLDITPLVMVGKDNVVAVRVEDTKGMGGLMGPVKLHCTDRLYQTLPLFNQLETTGVYLWSDQLDVREKSACLHVESQVANDYDSPQTFVLSAIIRDNDRTMIRELRSAEITLEPGARQTIHLSAVLPKLRFWSWGYGYLYHVTTSVQVKGKTVDKVVTSTGIRKVSYRNGTFFLNDRGLQLKGYTLPGRLDWPEVGAAVSPWLSDFSQSLIERGNANLLAWTGNAPLPQEVEACDRMGLLQCLPAGYAEIIRYRNSPSLVFYAADEAADSPNSLSEVKTLRGLYDPNGGRMVGLTGPTASTEAEFSGEKEWVVKSASKPRLTWGYSLPEERDETAYLEAGLLRWQDFWDNRPGTGRRVNTGALKEWQAAGAKDFGTEWNAWRQTTESYWVHQVLWNGWVDNDKRAYHTHPVGQWDYPEGSSNDILCVSNADKVELFVNGISQGYGQKEGSFLFRFPQVAFKKGVLKAVGYDERDRPVGNEAEIYTPSAPTQLRLSLVENPNGFAADGADMALVDVEILDKNGRPCPSDQRSVTLRCQGSAGWIGADSPDITVAVQQGTLRRMIRSNGQAGAVRLIAQTDGLTPDTLDFVAKPIDSKAGLSLDFPQEGLISYLWRGATPTSASYSMSRINVSVRKAVASSQPQAAAAAYDDNELTAWTAGRGDASPWMEFQLSRQAQLCQAVLRLGGFERNAYRLRLSGYWLDVEGQEQSCLLWEGRTQPSLGYVSLPLECPQPIVMVKIEQMPEPGVPGLQVAEVEFYSSSLGSDGR